MVDLRVIPGVELLKVGSWQPSAGPEDWTVTAADLESAVAAHKAGVLRRPVVTVGHTGPGSPALGRVDNLRLTDGGNTLLGDLVDVPSAIATMAAYAWPSRSVEALLNYQDPDGRTWPLVLSGLALLGSEPPAVETLQEITDLYGVTASSSGARVVVTINRGAGDHSRAVAVAAARRERTHRTLSQPKG